MGIIFSANAQQENKLSVPDTSQQKNKINNFTFDADTIKQRMKTADSVKISKKSNPIKEKVIYKSTDSLRFNVKEKKVYLFNTSDISYQKINLQAYNVEMDFKKNEVFAIGIEDTTGTLIGNPAFKEGEKVFNSKEMHYNFTSKKGLTKEVITKENEGFLHGELVKKMSDDITYIRNGKFTTCDLDNPHFDIRFGRAKAIPDKKIVTGPAFLYIEDIPTPLFIPVGFFPNSKKQTSGILFPSYGESPNRGFFFENGGYYFAISDKIDLSLRGDIYTRGSWAIKALSNYNKRYRYSGNITVNYMVDFLGEKGAPDYSKNTSFKILWNHVQDAKARPNSNFSASVNIASEKSNRSVRDLNNLFTNTTNSSISYVTRFGEDVNFSINATESYNINTHAIDLNLPTINLNTNTFYPLRNKNKTSDFKWYENISINYSMGAQNLIKTADSTIFKQSTLDAMQNGISHAIPISSNIKVLKYFNLSNSISYNERWYFKTIRKGLDKDSNVVTTNSNGFAAARDFSFRTALNSTLYGMLQFKYGPVKAIRHVLQSSIGFSYHPDFAQPMWGNMRTYVDKYGKTQQYSIFESSLYGGPPIGKSGSVNFSFGNNFEMKVRNRKDTITGMRKVVLIENLSVSTSYNIAADSLKWAPVSISGQTTLFKYMVISFNDTYDPYRKNYNGTRINTYEWDYYRRMFRLDYNSWNLSLSLPLSPATFKKAGTTADANKAKTAKPAPIRNVSNINQVLDDNVDFDVLWNVNLSYSYNYQCSYISPIKPYNTTVSQTLFCTNSFNLTPKWKIGSSIIYDFTQKQFVVNSVEVVRDLHCWEMRFNWMPMGYFKSWAFTINVKASVLKDLKWDKKKDFRDTSY